MQPSYPPVAHIVGVLLVTAFTAACFPFGSWDVIGIGGTGRDVDVNTIGYASGCFVGILMLYLFLVADNKKRATLRYSDWRVVTARKAVGWLTFGSWVFGAVHLWFWALDLTRP